MRSIFRRLVGLDRNAVLEDVELIDGGHVVAHVRPSKRFGSRCGLCRQRCPGYDQGAGRRRWRGLDLGTVKVFVEADAPRVSCREHGVVVAAVPWARHDARFTTAFDDTVAWLASTCSKSAVTALMRIAWVSVGAVIDRVVAETDAKVDRLEGLRRVGIDEISYRKGQRYLTVVVDHDSGRLVWAAPGRDRATLHRFFDALGPDRSQALTHVSADGAGWISAVVAERAPAAVLCADAFHIVSWATRCLDVVRREVWNDARRAGHRTRRGGGPDVAFDASTGDARKLAHARYALWKNPEDLTGNQRAKLAWIATTSPKLHRAYRLKEGLRLVFALKGTEGKHALARWLAQAQRSRLPVFVELARRVRRHRDAIHATLDHDLSNALVESVNTRIRLITRMAFGFHSPQPLIALAMLGLGGYRPHLPGR